PVAISANTTYVVAYHSSNGYYNYLQNYFATGLQNGSLTALADGTDGPNGLSLYTATPAFPTNTFVQTNYWVDLIFSGNYSGPTPPTVTLTNIPSGATGITPDVRVAAFFSEPLDPTTVNTSSVFMQTGSTTIASTVSYDNASSSLTLDPNARLSPGTT